MNSIDVKDFQFTITNFIDKFELPYEVKRLVLKEILEDVTAKANNELLLQAKEREMEGNKDA